MPNGQETIQGIPLPDGEWVYSERFLQALDAAARMHGAQRRKGSDIPYLSHLLGTCSIAMEYGADEDEAIAALLHDAIEDVRPTEAARQAVALFGPRVLAIVVGCSDSDTHPRPPWRERKERYIAHLAEADASVLLVSASDKLHNARAILADLRRIGVKVWDIFNASRDDQLWYYRSLVEAFRANPDHDAELIGELDWAVAQIERFAGARFQQSRELPDDHQTSDMELSEGVPIDEPAMLIRIAQLWDPSMSDDELYDATRGHWKVGPRRDRAELALAVAKGVVREVFVIESWHRAGTTRSVTEITPTHRRIAGSSSAIAPPMRCARSMSAAR